MLETTRLRNLVIEIGKHGLLFGSKSPWSTGPGVESGSVAEALPDVQAYVDDPELPDGVEFPELTRKEIALAVVAGARRAAADVGAIERAAAEVARGLGATVRELAGVADISERAANDRYRRVVLDPAIAALLKWAPKKHGTPDELAGEIGDPVTFAGLDGRPQTATFVEFYVDTRGDVYVVRHDDGRQEEISIADIIRATPAGQARHAKYSRTEQGR